MPIVLNEGAKVKEDPFHFSKLPIVRYIAQQQILTGLSKANILVNLGMVAYHIKDDLELVKMFKTGTDLNEALHWSTTPQGRDYWENIHETLTEE